MPESPISNSKQTPHLVKLQVSPNGWQGLGTFEPTIFECIPLWSDGVSDLDCRRAGQLPIWGVEGYGSIEGVVVEGQVPWEELKFGPTENPRRGEDEDRQVKGVLLHYSDRIMVHQGGKVGRSVLYRSGLQAGVGRVQVSYAGKSACVVVKGESVTGATLPQDYLYLVDLEQVSVHETSAGKEVDNALAAQNRQVKKFNRQRNVASVEQEARLLSQRLEAYIRDWVAGKVPAALPKGLLPPGIDNKKSKEWTLLRPEEVEPEAQWGIRPAHKIKEDYAKQYIFSPDPHATYALCVYAAPIGSKLVFEGEFPHCRFMSIQVSPPFDPRYPLTGGIGAAEVPLVDVDMEPLPGHVNPFHPGIDRDSPNRSYRAEFEIGLGNASKLNPVLMRPPDYRAPAREHTRVAGPFNYSGFIGKGCFLPGIIWLRYYLPDEGTGPLAGVRLPKITLELPSGEKFWLKCDPSLGFLRANTLVAGVQTPPRDPSSRWGPDFGWLKMYGLHLVYVEGFVMNKISPKASKIVHNYATRLIRAYDRLMWNRGPGQRPPGNYENSCTCCPYNSYLTREAYLGEGKLLVITGKMPTTPKTMHGDRFLEKAEARYWSLTRCHEDPNYLFPAMAYGSLVDEEIIRDQDNRYIICLSRRQDRPKNATEANGVTWQEWGPDSANYMTLRWMSVAPEHVLPGIVPNEINIPWAQGAWSQKHYDQALVGLNQPGKLGAFHPLLHYLTTAEFEALGDGFQARDIPAWK